MLKHGDLSQIGLSNGSKAVSFYIENNLHYGNCIFIINTENYSYNIYSIKFDQWLFNGMQTNIFDERLANSYARMLFFNENLLIISLKKYLFFYDLTIITQPRLFGVYELVRSRSVSKGYQQHGFVCIEKQDRFLRLLLFGGIGNVAFAQTFTQILVNFKDVIGSINMKQFKNFNKIDISERGLSSNKFNLTNINNENELNILKHNISNCGYTTVLNDNNERLLIVIGGQGPNIRSIVVYNCQTKELFVKDNILPVDCSLYPATIRHSDHIHVVSQTTHFLVNLNALLCFL